MTKLNVLLAKTDHLASTWKGAIADYFAFFKKSGGSFIGEKKTYTPREGTIDDPSKRGNKTVTTTVDEKLDYFQKTQSPYIDTLFALEATNASGMAKAELKVDDVSFGVLTSLELLRLKTILETEKLRDMFAEIPVRSDSEVWVASENDEYTGRKIFETALISGVSKTTTKVPYILEDPNIAKINTGSIPYTPQLAMRDDVVILGDYTTQKFSGEWSHRERAAVLARRDKLLVAVLMALKVCNETPVVESQLTGDKLFNYLLKGA